MGRIYASLSKRLNEHNNFHLSFKVIQTNDYELIKTLKSTLLSFGRKVEVVDNYNLFENLLKAYENNVEIILCDESCDVLLPLCVVITNDNINLIKPYIETLYMQKDNRIIQKIKTTSNKKESTLTKVNNYQEAIEYILKILKVK